MRIDIRNLADIPLTLKLKSQASISFEGSDSIELQGMAKKVVIANLADMTQPSYLLDMEVTNFQATDKKTAYLYSTPINGMLFTKREGFRCAIIPQPKVVRMNDCARFVIDNETKIQVHGDKAISELHFLTERLENVASLNLEIDSALGKQCNVIVFKEISESELGNDGYRLQVSEDRIDITASEASGFFYAIQTLLQLLPAEIYSNSPAIERCWDVPAVFIEDAPRFSYLVIFIQ